MIKTEKFTDNDSLQAALKALEGKRILETQNHFDGNRILYEDLSQPRDLAAELDELKAKIEALEARVEAR